jgi:hypothetical protein
MPITRLFFTTGAPLKAAAYTSAYQGASLYLLGAGDLFNQK